jgi:hypothetical protein
MQIRFNAICLTLFCVLIFYLHTYSVLYDIFKSERYPQLLEDLC